MTDSLAASKPLFSRPTSKHTYGVDLMNLKIPRVGIYCRVSSDDQAERGTIEPQIEFATKYCDFHELPITARHKGS